MMKYIKRKLFNWLMKDLYVGILEHDFYRVDRNRLIINGVPLSDAETQEISSQAKMMMNTPLYRLLTQEMKKLASKQMYSKSQSWEDMAGGKWILYTLEIYNKKVENLARLK